MSMRMPVTGNEDVNKDVNEDVIEDVNADVNADGYEYVSQLACQ